MIKEVATHVVIVRLILVGTKKELEKWARASATGAARGRCSWHQAPWISSRKVPQIIIISSYLATILAILSSFHTDHRHQSHTWLLYIVGTMRSTTREVQSASGLVSDLDSSCDCAIDRSINQHRGIASAHFVHLHYNRITPTLVSLSRRTHLVMTSLLAFTCEQIPWQSNTTIVSRFDRPQSPNDNLEIWWVRYNIL